jgi:hypothetical protein
MHNIVLDQHFKGLEKLRKILKCFFLCELSLGFDLFLQSSIVAVLINKIVIICSFEYFNESDNVSGILYFRERVNLIDGELLKFGA